MEKYEAISILKALACCSISELHCYECPMWDEVGECKSWTDADVVTAIRTLNEA